MADTLTILGASARAAAFSAVRAGIAPVAGDLFADVDLAACSRATRVNRYPHDLARVCAGPQPGPWMYTGALENWPDLVERMAGRRPLLGNDGRILREVRDPLRLRDALTAAGIDTPRVPLDPSQIPRDGSWLLKPLRSAGGHQIEPYAGDAAALSQQHWYYQEYIAGAVYSAVFVADGTAAVLLGATRQLVGEAWTHARQFQYCGSIGPLALAREEHAALQTVGTCLVQAFQLRGVFGVDYVESAGRLWPIEVNPRYTASAEIVEWHSKQSIVGLHVAACLGNLLPTTHQSRATPIRGKAVLFARQAITVSNEMSQWLLDQNCEAPLGEGDDWEWPQFADIPQPGTHLRAGAPVLTLFACGDDDADVTAGLRAALAAVERRLY